MPTLSIIIPVYNESKTVARAVRSVLVVDLGDWQKEIIVIDDGSTDGTASKLKQFRSQVTIIRHKCNRGKGAALRTGFKRATGRAVVVQDADLEYNPNEWRKMLKKYHHRFRPVIFGSRNIHPRRRGYWHYYLGAKTLDVLTNLIYRSRLTDTYTCYKLIDIKVLDSLRLTADGFEIEAQITTEILKRNICIREVAIDYRPRRFKQGKKIRLKDAFKGLWMIVRNRY
jgi:glycosyltransferase involved in cell wall biosynthesis